MFDVFYYGPKPNLFEFEQAADSLEDAAKKSRTGFYWYIYGGNDYTGFDFEYQPVPWESDYTHIWPDQHNNNGNVYLTQNPAGAECYHDGGMRVHRLPVKEQWSIPDHIDPASINWRWSPNPMDPAYIYHFPDQHQSASGVTYVVPGATEVKLVDAFVVRAIDNPQAFGVNIAVAEFDYSWHPNPLDPPYTYVFGNQWNPAVLEPTIVYTVHDATEIKYIDDVVAQVAADITNWEILDEVEEFDFSWRPNPTDPPYNYVFGNQWHPPEVRASVVYCVPGATENKFVSELQVRRRSVPGNFKINAQCVFDYSWEPDPGAPPYIYVFGNQWHAAEKMSTVEYHVEGATEQKYVDELIATLTPTDTNWTIVVDHAIKFDYSWHPDPGDPPYIYVFGNQHYPGTIMPTVKYTVPGAVEEKFVEGIVARLLPSRINWEILEPIDENIWDWSWVPNPRDPAYIYEWGNQHWPAEYHTSLRYVVPGAAEVKYMEARTVRLPQPELFENQFDIDEFDYSWHPNPKEPPLTYIWGNQWNPAVLEPTVIFRAGGDEIKYMEAVAKISAKYRNWILLDNIEEFDYSWKPNPTDPPYIYVFGNQWMSAEIRPALEYQVDGATERKYMSEPKARRIGNPDKFIRNYPNITFDYSWEPEPGSPAYNYVFGNQYYAAEIDATVEYHMPGATERKYMQYPTAQLTEHRDHHWHTIIDCEWDYSWHPEPGSPAYIYVFGNQWYPAEKMATVEYHMPGATERKYMDEPRARLPADQTQWTVPEEVDAANIDFSWVPDPGNPPYIYHFGTEHQVSVGLTYTVPGATDIRFESEIPRIIKLKKSVEVLDIFFVDRNNATAGVRFDRLQAQYPNIQRIRYANSIMATIQRCVARSKTNKFWVISSEYNYNTFDFTWHAQPWQSYMTHVFPSQHNKWSDTFLINRWEFERHSRWAAGIEQFPNLNFVTNQTVTKPENLNNIYFVDHGNPESDTSFKILQAEYPEIVRTRFVDNYLDTFKRIMTTAETEFVWILNSTVNYDYFDFTWQPEPWQREMIHCFGSARRPRGDTFYIHVESFKTQMVELELLDWFNVINYIETNQAPVFPMPVHVYESDDLIEEIKNYNFETPYVMFTNDAVSQFRTESPCLWTKKDRTVVRVTNNGATCIVPRDIKADLRTQIYDYPYLDRIEKAYNGYYPGRAMPGIDIVYISNGEPDEQRWYEHLCYQSNTNDIEWVRGVNGRTAAYQEAARRSRTPWFFAVFAKLEVAGGEFPWFTWQPDYWQGPKHYIFNARNPLNGLEYGHQGIICYNKNLVLQNNNPGIDFTLSQPHESVPILSGTAHFNQSAWMTWRTAFREVVKLKHFDATEPTLETAHRLDVWLTQAKGAFAEDCLAGARDAVDYYNSVSGDYEKLKLSFEWAWLNDYYQRK